MKRRGREEAFIFKENFYKHLFSKKKQENHEKEKILK
jgi:hypothetical protein